MAGNEQQRNYRIDKAKFIRARRALGAKMDTETIHRAPTWSPIEMRSREL
jgi:hypothetical protein